MRTRADIGTGAGAESGAKQAENGNKRANKCFISMLADIMRLRAEGLTETEIGARLGGVRQCTISRVLELRKLDPSVSALAVTEGRFSLGALRELAGWDKDAQLAALGELVKLASGRRMIKRTEARATIQRAARIVDRSPFNHARCYGCPSRTGAQPDLFGGADDGKLGRCLDAACWSRCCNLVEARKKRWK